MSVTKELISNFKEEDFFKKVNLHIHSICSDGQLSPQEIIEQAKALKLEHISITDHNTLEAYNILENDSIDGINLISGIEFDCWHKTNFMHLLGYGFDVNDEGMRELCAKDVRETKHDIIRIFSSRKACKVIETIKNAGGIAVFAHPGCSYTLRIERMIKELVDFGLDGIEIFYPYVRYSKLLKLQSLKKIEKISKKFQLLSTGGTDCHGRVLASR